MKPEIWQEQPGKPETSHFVVAPEDWEEYERLLGLAKNLRNAGRPHEAYEERAKHMERPACKTS